MVKTIKQDEKERRRDYENSIKCRILAINPPIEDFKVQGGLIFPLGLLVIISVLKKAGAHIDFIDCMNPEDKAVKKALKVDSVYYNVFGTCCSMETETKRPDILSDVPRPWKLFGMNYDLLLKELGEYKTPNVILITSGLTYHYRSVFKTISVLKKAFSNVPILLGGIYATLCYEHAVKFSNADYVVRGPGERIIIDLLKNKYNTNISNIPMNNHDEIPGPDLGVYFQRSTRLRHAPIMMNRGCPFKCSYCASDQLSGFVQYSIDNVFQYIIKCVSFGIRSFIFYDDALLINGSSRIDVLLRKIQARKLRVYFSTPNSMHARYITQRRAELMKACGFRYLRLSIETTDHFRMKENPKISTTEFLKAVDYLKAAGFDYRNIGVYYMVGQPAQTRNDMIDTMMFIYKQNVIAIPLQYSPIPGTRDYIKAVADGIINIDMDPLLTNRECFLFSGDETQRETVKRIMRLASCLKRSIEYNCNFSDTDPVSARVRVLLSAM